jgi:hypothetical protein
MGRFLLLMEEDDTATREERKRLVCKYDGYGHLPQRSGTWLYSFDGRVPFCGRLSLGADRKTEGIVIIPSSRHEQIQATMLGKVCPDFSS